MQVLTSQEEAMHLSRSLLERNEQFSMNPITLDDIFYQMVGRTITSEVEEEERGMSKVGSQLLASILVNAIYEMKNYPVILINTVLSPLSFLILIVFVSRGELLGVAIIGGLIMTMFQAGTIPAVRPLPSQERLQAPGYGGGIPHQGGRVRRGHSHLRADLLISGHHHPVDSCSASTCTPP